MNKRKIFRLKPELRKFLGICSLAKYIAFALFFNYFIAGFVFMDFGINAIEISLIMDGIVIVFATLVDILSTVAKWIATHRLVCRIEEKQITIM